MFGTWVYIGIGDDATAGTQVWAIRQEQQQQTTIYLSHFHDTKDRQKKRRVSILNGLWPLLNTINIMLFESFFFF